MKNGELISIGAAYVDINAPDFPLGASGLGLETEIVGQTYTVEPGGSAVNFARLCSSLELPAKFVGKIGNDSFGNTLTELLLKDRVVPALVVAENVSTNLSFNMVNGDGKSVMAVVGTANQSLTSEEVYNIVSEGLAESTHLFIGGCFKLKNLMPTFEKLANNAKALGVTVVLDHARLNSGVREEEKERVKQLALAADVYLPSKDEFEQLWGVDTIEDGLSLLGRKGYNGIVVVKDGDRGAVTISNDETVRVPAFHVQPIHTIGAGDSFNAGFISSQHRGDTLLQSITFGCATAALKISREELPTYQDVINYLEAA